MLQLVWYQKQLLSECCCSSIWCCVISQPHATKRGTLPPPLVMVKDAPLRLRTAMHTDSSDAAR